MRIVVVGAGKLGYTIAELLSREDGYDVAMIDHNEEQLEKPKNTLDVLTIHANGASPITMEDPDVQGAQILIAVTGSDEVNMVASILAKKHGIKHTIARIRDMRFMSEAKDYLKSNFDIDLMLNPELITAHEIDRILMTPAALNVEDFANGKVRLFETRMREGHRIEKVPFRELEFPDGVLAGMIFRGHRMIIPHGDDQLLAGDNVYFIGIPEKIEAFSATFAEHRAQKLERVLIIGAGRTGRALARQLEAQGVEVKAFDKDAERCRLLAEKLDHSTVICGDGTDIDLLLSEGVAQADVVVCLTEDDKLNLMIALLTKHLGAKRTVVRIIRNEYVELMEKVGVDVALSVRLLAASEVLAFVRHGGVVSVSLLEGAKAEAVEVILQAGARVAGKKLMHANLPRACLVCAVVRGEEAFIPRGDSVLLPDDRIILFVETQHSSRVMEFFR